MPLILMCGNPGSGKTTRAREIAQYLTEKYKQNVVVINEEFLKVNKDESYQNANEEKMIRGKLKFEVEKNLTGNTIVICDSLNYIKGYRYQMFCIAREQKTTYCVVFCNTSLETAKVYNSKNESKFSDAILEDLSKRLEPPHMKNRWDVPLFERREEEATPVEEIAQVLLFETKKSKDPVSTKQVLFELKKDEKLDENYLYELDKICQDVCDQAVMAKMQLKNNWSALLLKKVKKDFVGMIKEKPIPLKSIKESFTNYLIEADKRK